MKEIVGLNVLKGLMEISITIYYTGLSPNILDLGKKFKWIIRLASVCGTE